MKKRKVLIFIFIAIILGIGSAIGYNYFKNEYTPKQEIYYCTSSFENYRTEYYSLTDETGKENNNLKCTKKININCENCELVGNNYGFDYNDTKVIVLYNPNDKTATIYDTNKKSIYDTVKSVKFNDRVVQRKKYQIALFNNNKLFGFIFPTDCKSGRCEILYKLDKKKTITGENNTENYIHEYYTHSYQSYYSIGFEDPMDISSGDHFITNIQNGIIPVWDSYGLKNLYNVIEEKYLLDPQKGEFYNTYDNGFIFYQDGKFYDNDINKNEVKYYDNYGNYVFSDKNNSFGYNVIEILYIIDENTVLVIGYSTKNNSTPEGIKLIDKKGNIIMNVPLSRNNISNDIKSKLTSNENYSKLDFPVNIYEYFTSAYYTDDTKSKISLSFNYSNKYYQLYSNVRYEIDLNKNEIVNKEVN